MVREELIDWKLYACGANGQIYSFIRKRYLNGYTDKNGYVKVGLKCIDGKFRYFYWHRVIYTFFNGTILEGMQCNHISEVKTDNRLSNLNLMTPKENSNWASRNERVAASKIGILNTKKSKPIVALDSDGNIVKEYPSAAEAYRCGYIHAWECCNGLRKTCGGYAWKYA